MTSAVPAVPASPAGRARARQVFEPASGMSEPLAAGPGYRVERRILPPGRMLSLRYRCRSAEHLTVVAGEVHLTIGDDTMVLETDDSIYVPFGAMHRLANRGTRTAVIIAVACGDGDDDIVQLEGEPCTG